MIFLKSKKLILLCFYFARKKRFIDLETGEQVLNFMSQLMGKKNFL